MQPCEGSKKKIKNFLHTVASTERAVPGRFFPLEFWVLKAYCDSLQKGAFSLGFILSSKCCEKASFFLGRIAEEE